MARDHLQLLRLLLCELTDRLTRYAPLDARMHGRALHEWLPPDARGALLQQHGELQRDFKRWQHLQHELALLEALQQSYRELFGPTVRIDGDGTHPYNERAVTHTE